MSEREREREEREREGGGGGGVGLYLQPYSSCYLYTSSSFSSKMPRRLSGMRSWRPAVWEWDMNRLEYSHDPQSPSELELQLHSGGVFRTEKRTCDSRGCLVVLEECACRSIPINT